jgi:hypothetical protein
LCTWIEPRFSEFQIRRACASFPDPNRALRFLKWQVERESHSSWFSGVGAENTASTVQAVNLSWLLGVEVRESQFLAACDNYRPSQNELLHHPHPPQCLFGDGCDFFKPKVKTALQVMANEKGISRQTLMPLIRMGGGALLPTAYCMVHRRLDFNYDHLFRFENQIFPNLIMRTQ